MFATDSVRLIWHYVRAIISYAKITWEERNRGIYYNADK